MVTFSNERAVFHRTDDGIESQLEVVVSAEEDVEVRRLSLTNKSDRTREIEITSYAEIVLGRQEDDVAHPAFGKLFIQTGVPAEQLRAALRSPATRRLGGRRLGLPHAQRRRTGAVADRMGEQPRALPRSRPRPRPSRSRWTAGRSPARPARCSIRSSACASGCGCSPAGSPACRSRLVRRPIAKRAQALAQKYHDPGAAARAFSMAYTHSQMLLRHLGITSELARQYDRLASRVLYLDESLRAEPSTLAKNTRAQEGLWAHGVSGDLPILLVEVVEDDDLTLVRQVLQAQEYWRLQGLKADVVILNEHPISYLDEMQEHLAALIDSGPWSAWKERPGGIFLIRGDGLADEDRVLFESVARAVLVGDRGELSQQLDRPAPAPAPADDADPATDRLEPKRRPRSICPPLTMANGIGGFTRGRPRVRARPDAETSRRPRHGPTSWPIADSAPSSRLGRLVHMGGQQPSEPADAVCERSGLRFDGGGNSASRRGQRRGVGRHAGPAGAIAAHHLGGPAPGRASRASSGPRRICVSNSRSSSSPPIR